VERRRYARTAVHLDIALLDDRAMPRGCQVCDVSQGGMRLQFDPPVANGTFETSATVKVRVSVKQGEERTVLLFPASVRRVEEKGLGIEFHKPSAELTQLLKPYRLDKPETVEAAVTPAAVAGQEATGGAQPPAAAQPARPPYRPAPAAGVRLAQRLAAVRKAMARAGSPRAAPTTQTDAAASPGDHRILQLGLASLAVAAAIIVFELATTASTSRRLSALEQAASQQAATLASLQIRLTADKGQDRQLTGLHTRVNELTVAVAALESGQLARSGDTATTGVPPPNHIQPADAAGEERPLRITPGAAAAQSPAGDGPWVLNLVSLFDQAAANDFVGKARSSGIPVEQNQMLVKGKPVWRLQVSGFASREAARRYAEANKNKLGVKNVWIFKR
jgi:cell division septation protein DedD